MISEGRNRRGLAAGGDGPVWSPFDIAISISSNFER